MCNTCASANMLGTPLNAMQATSTAASTDSRNSQEETGRERLRSLPSPCRLTVQGESAVLNLRPGNVTQAADMIYSYGCCIVKSSLSAESLTQWLQEMQRIPVSRLEERNPFDASRFSYGRCGMLPDERYAELEEDVALNEICCKVLSPGWVFGKRGGDLVTRNSCSAQNLHSDWGRYPTYSRALGYALVASLALHDIPAEQAALRIMPWCMDGYGSEPYIDEEKGKRCGFQVPLARGEIIIRDCRMAHAGMPNTTNRDRVLPGIHINSAEWLASEGYR